MADTATTSSRRAFLVNSGAALTGALAFAKSAEAEPQTQDRKAAARVETAVIGGGISGLYAAWRLGEGGKKVALYEASDRLGGRLYTVPIKGTRIHAELGAMRFTTGHRLLCGLIESLGLKTKPLEFKGNWFYHLRGRRLLEGELAKGGPYFFDGSPQLWGRRKGPADLLYYTLLRTVESLTLKANPGDKPESVAKFNSDLPAVKTRCGDLVAELKHASGDLAQIGNAWRKIDKRTWRFIKRYGQVENIPLHEIGFWNLLEHYLGNEGFQLVHDALGYESIVSNWNAAEAIPWFIADFSNDDYSMLEGGFDVLVRRLEKLIPAHGSTIHKEFKLRQLDWSEAEREWILTFENESTIKARRVILALPRKPLERIQVKKGDKPDPRWEELKGTTLTAVEPRRLFKVLLIFETAWWEDVGPSWTGSAGRRVITDLPLRQVYYYSPEWIASHNPPASGNPPDRAVVMASYSDEHYASYWRPFAPKAKGGRRSIKVQPRMIEKLRAQLGILHGIEVPEPIRGIFMDWATEPNIEAGWHSWEVNEQGDEVAASLVEPLQGLSICGEAYSGEQGWIEGALQSTERVLRKLGLRNPTSYQGSDFDDYITF
jgi:monoamine oxidase